MTVGADSEVDLDARFAALADPTRRAILTRLGRGEATVGELAEPFDMTYQAVSRHVGVLKRSGLIDQRVDGQRRPCRLNVQRLEDLSGWLIEQQQQWESRLERLEKHVTAAKKKGTE